jgi:asparagine synthase (glutamine-hydrolysing)
MCGITGFIEFGQRLENQESYLSEMVGSMYQRGPDASNFKIYNTKECSIGFGHARLAVIDLSEDGTQPMSNDSFSIVFNGEIYNYKEIKAELIKLGYTFSTNSDTEVILKAYEEWAERCVDKFIGMFAFAIYDFKKGQISFFRDRAGVKPFYYYWDETTFIFGSELKPFHKHPNFKKSINISAVSLFLQHGYIPNPHSIFQNTSKLEPGHFLTLNLSNGKQEIKQYWDIIEFYNKPKLVIPYEEAMEETERLLKSAFQYRMVADVPVGVFLSGGYDSTAVASILQANSDQKINTFTIGFNNNAFNEAEYAKETAGILGTNHEEYYCNYKDAISIIPKLPEIYDEPFGDSSAIPTTMVSEMARKKVTVCLSADGGDEIFAGYNKYTSLMDNLNTIRKVPKGGRKLVASLMNSMPFYKLPPLNQKENLERFYKIVSTLYKEEEIDGGSLIKYASMRVHPSDLQKYFVKELQPLTTAFDKHSLLGVENSDIDRMTAIDFTTYMCDDILTKVDKASMSVSLEGREPLLDHRIAEFAAQLPTEYKLHNGVKKRILKDIVHKYVPKEKMDRPKSGFGIPVMEWGRKELKHFFDEYFSESFIKKQGIFNYSTINDLKNKYMAGNNSAFERCWYILNFQLWYAKWM